MRNGVKQAQIVRLDKRIINQPLASRISGHVINLIAKILYIADAMLVKTRLPHLPSKLFSD